MQGWFLLYDAKYIFTRYLNTFSIEIYEGCAILEKILGISAKRHMAEFNCVPDSRVFNNQICLFPSARFFYRNSAPIGNC